VERTSRAVRVVTRVIYCGIFLIFADTVACPLVIHDRMNVELAVIATIRTFHVAQTQHYSTFSHYAGSLRDLAAAGLLDAQLGTGKHLSYNFVIAGTRDGYAISAQPSVFTTDGSHTFYSDQTIVIHEHQGPEPASAQDPEMK